MRIQVIRKTVAGGLIGALATNPRLTLARVIEAQAAEGWRLTAITPLTGSNLLMALVSLVVLVLTLGLWTFGAGYLLAFEKD